MAKMNIDAMCADLEACVGKDDYGTPETIDLHKLMSGGYSVMCAGLIRAAGLAYGVSIPNGSNSIWRESLKEKGYITDGKPSESYPHKENGLKSSQLKKGMLVFKWKSTGCAKSKHEKDGLGNYCHIGMVTSAKPLHIVHASSESKTISKDTKIGKWCAWGWAKGFPSVKDDEVQTEEPEIIEQERGETGMENANGRLKATTTINLRKGPGTQYDKVGTFKKGEEADFVGQIENGWVQIEKNGEEVWICTKMNRTRYVKVLEVYLDEGEEEDPEDGVLIGAPVIDPSDDDETQTDDLRDTVEELCEGSVTFAAQMTEVCRILRNAGFDISNVPGMVLPEDIE